MREKKCRVNLTIALIFYQIVTEEGNVPEVCFAADISVLYPAGADSLYR